MRNHIHKKAFCHQTGLTLVEIMVAITLSLVILAGVIEMFVATKQTYRVEEGLARVQENARYAMNILTKDLRMAGYVGCIKFEPGDPSNVNNIVSPDAGQGGLADFAYALKGFNSTSASGNNITDWSPNLPSYFANGDVIAGTDVIFLKYASAYDIGLTGNLTATNANIQITSNPNGEIVAGDILLVSDCGGADMFAATNVSESAGKVTIAHANSRNTDNKLSKLYGADAEISKLISKVYFIANNNYGIPSLYVGKITSNTTTDRTELVEGVENMQILFGVDTDADGIANQYQTANTVETGNNWGNVSSIRIGLLLQTLEFVSSSNDTRTYNVAGTNIASTGTSSLHDADRRLRYVFSSTIKIRNLGNL